jgi:hypothetical protein
MTKLPIAILVGAMTIGTCVQAADQNGQGTQAAPKDCSKLSGKEKDACVQATPAGPVDMQSGTQKKGKSEIAKDRDQQKEETQGTANAPAQANDAIGKPKERTSTGEAQTGTNAAKATPSAKTPPPQSKDTVGHPDARTTTGEAQTGQAPSQSPTRTQ